MRYLAVPCALLFLLAAAPQDRVAPEEVRLTIVEVSSSSRGGTHRIVIRARALLPDGRDWGQGLDVQAEARRLRYFLEFRDQIFAYPSLDTYMPPPAVGTIERRGEVELQFETSAPGPYLVTIYLDPAIQRNIRALDQLRRMMRLRRDEGVPRMALCEEIVVWAGDTLETLEQMPRRVEAYWRITRQAIAIFDDIERQGQEVSANDEEWAEQAMRHITRLLEIKQDITRYRNESLLAASFGFLDDVLLDLENVARFLRDILEYERRRNAGGGGAGGGGGDLPASGTPGNALDEWGSSDEILTKEDLGEGDPMVLEAGSYRGALTTARMRRLLLLAPIFGPREALLWYIRYAGRGREEIHTAFQAWRTAPNEERRQDLLRLLRDRLREWTEIAQRVPQAIRALSNAAQNENRRHWRERGWDRYFEGVAELFDNPARGGMGLRQYCEMVEQAIAQPPAPQESDDLRVRYEELGARIEAMEARNRAPLVPPEDQERGP